MSVATCHDVHSKSEYSYNCQNQEPHPAYFVTSFCIQVGLGGGIAAYTFYKKGEYKSALKCGVASGLGVIGTICSIAYAKIWPTQGECPLKAEPISPCGLSGYGCN